MPNNNRTIILLLLREQKKHELKKLVMVSVKPEDVLADHVELNVKGIFMPRGDLYRMMSSIVGKTVYGSKTFQVPVIFVCSFLFSRSYKEANMV